MAFAQVVKDNPWLDKLLEPLPSLVKENLWAIVILVVWLVKAYFDTLKPINEIAGSLVHTIKNEEEWNDAVTKVLGEDKIIVVDFYANWCPPCKLAAPVYSRMSIEYMDKPVVFWKVNVDTASSVAVNQNISALPTFRIYTKHVGDNGVPGLTQLDTVEGWKGEAIFREFVSARISHKEKKMAKIESENNSPQDIKDKKTD